MGDEAPQAPENDGAVVVLKVGDAVQHKKQRWIGTVARLGEPTNDGVQRVYVLWEDGKSKSGGTDGASAPSRKATPATSLVVLDKEQTQTSGRRWPNGEFMPEQNGEFQFFRSLWPRSGDVRLLIMRGNGG